MIDSQIKHQFGANNAHHADDDVIAIDDEHQRLQSLTPNQQQNAKTNNLQILINDLIKEDYKQCLNNVVVNGQIRPTDVIEMNKKENPNDEIDLCSLCQQPYLYKKPKLLSCLHTYCEICLPKLLTKINPSKFLYMCNACKQETDVDCIIDNLFSFNYSIYNTQQETQNDNAQQTGQNERQSFNICTNCDENNYSEWYCTDCNELLCDGCRYAHSRVKVTKDHVITKNSSNNNCSQKSMNQSVRITHNCHIHTMEKLSIFCETCDILTCRDCQLSPLHKEHSYKYMHEAANLQRSKFTLCLKQLRQRKLLIEEAKQLYYERNSEISQQYDQITSQIKQVAANHINEVNNRTNQLVQYLENICNDKRLHIKRKTLQINDYFKKFNHSCKVVENAIKSPNEAALLLSKRLITNQLNGLMQEKIEVLNPQYRFVIQFVNEMKSDFKFGHLVIDGHQIYFPQMQNRFNSTTQSSTMPLQAQINMTNNELPKSSQNQQNLQPHEQPQANNHHNTTTVPGMVPHSVTLTNTTSALNNSGVHLAPQYQQYLKNNCYHAPCSPQHSHNIMPSASPSLPYNPVVPNSARNLDPTAPILNTNQFLQQHHYTQLHQQQQQHQLHHHPHHQMPSLNMRTLQNYNIMNSNSSSPSVKSHRIKYPTQNVNQALTANSVTQNNSKNPNRPMPILPKPGMANSTAGGSITNGTNATDMISSSSGALSPRYQMNVHSKTMQQKTVIPSSLLHHQKNNSAFVRKSAFMPHPSTTNLTTVTKNTAISNAKPRSSSTNTNAVLLNPKQKYHTSPERPSSVKSTVLDPAAYDARSGNSIGSTSKVPVADSSINPTEWIDSTAKNSESDINTDEKKVNQPADDEIQSPKSTVSHQQTLLTEEENTEAAQSQADVSPSSSSYSITTPPPLINTNNEQLEQVQSQITNMPTLKKFSTVQNNTDEISHFRNRSSSSRSSYSSNNDQAISDLADYPDDFIDTDDKNSSNQNRINKEPEENNVMEFSLHTHAATQDNLARELTDTNMTSNQSMQHDEVGTSASIENVDVTDELNSNETDISNEICAVCQNGGELLICDYCPRVYHLQCHVPTVYSKPETEWRCGLCEDLESILKSTNEHHLDHFTTTMSMSSVVKRKAAPLGLNKWELKICERMLLLLYSQPSSIPFHQPVNRTVQNYYKVIKHPMDFKTIKHKLYRGHFDHYNSLFEFLADVRLVFNNCALYNPPDTSIAIVSRTLSKKFENFVAKHLPEFALSISDRKTYPSDLNVLTNPLNKRSTSSISSYASSDSGCNDTDLLNDKDDKEPKNKKKKPIGDANVNSNNNFW